MRLRDKEASGKRVDRSCCTLKLIEIIFASYCEGKCVPSR